MNSPDLDSKHMRISHKRSYKYIAYFNGYFFTLKKGYTPETSVLIGNFDTF